MGGVVGGVGHLKKSSQAPPFSFPVYFFPLLARFFRSSAPVTESLARAFALAPAVTFAFTFLYCEPLLLAYSWATFSSKLFKIHATILTLRNETIVSIRESNAVSLEKIIWKSLSDHWSNSIRGTEKNEWNSVSWCQRTQMASCLLRFTLHRFIPSQVFALAL